MHPITVNGKLHDVPFDLSDITLGRYLAYYDQYGRNLDKELAELRQKDYKKHLESLGAFSVSKEDIELHQQLDLDDHLDREALSWFSFWTGHNFLEAKDLPEVAPLYAQYRIFRYEMAETIENKSDEFPLSIEWMDEQWSVQDYRVNPTSEMTFNEIITSKEVMRQVHALGLGQWDGLPYLCAVFLRRKDEPFSDTLIAEGGERLLLMQDLPMLHALQVAFFLSICVGIWNAHSLCSIEKEPEEQSLS